MKPKRLVLIFAPFACILFYALLVRMLHQEIPRATTEGVQLKIASLSSGEEIVVQRLFARRDVVAREYRIVTSGATKQVTVFSLADTWDGGRLKLTLDQLLAVRELTNSEAEGLDETVAFFRSRREEYSSAERHYSLSYFRSGKKIGEEFFIGFSLPSDLAYFRREGSTSALSYTELAERHGRDTRIGRKDGSFRNAGGTIAQQGARANAHVGHASCYRRRIEMNQLNPEPKAARVMPAAVVAHL